MDNSGKGGEFPCQKTKHPSDQIGGKVIVTKEIFWGREVGRKECSAAGDPVSQSLTKGGREEDGAVPRYRARSRLEAQAGLC